MVNKHHPSENVASACGIWQDDGTNSNGVAQDVGIIFLYFYYQYYGVIVMLMNMSGEQSIMWVASSFITGGRNHNLTPTPVPKNKEDPAYLVLRTRMNIMIIIIIMLRIVVALRSKDDMSSLIFGYLLLSL